MAETAYCTYTMKGIKEDFADWVSSISPEYTPFISMLKKFPVRNTIFNWQTDTLGAVNLLNKYEEGSDARTVKLTPTKVNNNYCQIMRKVVMVSDTASAVSSYGREKELFYQLKKASKELKRDNELIFLLGAQASRPASAGQAAQSASLGTLISATTTFGTGVTNLETTLFQATAKSYMVGAEPNLLMYSPELATHLAGLQEKAGTRQRIFENDKRFVFEVDTIVDPLGQEFKCLPNRWMPLGHIYGIRPEDVGMAVLRAPLQIKLAKDGSAEKYMIEQEVGLQLNNPEAAFAIIVNALTPSGYFDTQPVDVSGTTGAADLKFTVGADAVDGGAYQWEFKGPSDSAWADVTATQGSGGATKELTIAASYAVVANSGAMFRCKWTKTANSITSSAAKMYVEAV